ncbi:hypothetical protein Moror_10944 [Moniliophthora roreri MCA 2997]|uniref:Six-hairpin glycosidase n=1 Tax=Moniliophthora roreri (strain MCA 2997) TaxID=1381753 RepID=V2WYQ4_MONRO|nr:hypothetical protein Moror_10944 [Moniliophthora roreri MCA 2997]
MFSWPVALALLSCTSNVIFAWDRVFPFNPGFDIRAVTALAESLPSHSWEFGTACQALLELHNASLSVFSPCQSPAVPDIQAPTQTVHALQYADQKITIGTGANAFADGDGATSDSASLGVCGLLLGKTIQKYAEAAQSQLDYLVNEAPRWENGAISHWSEEAEIWFVSFDLSYYCLALTEMFYRADFVYMAPPFIAYSGLFHDHAALIEIAVEQCKRYREVLLSTTHPRLWKHIVGNMYPDPGFWSTGNAWAAAGMTRVLATVLRATCISPAQKAQWVDDLTFMIKEIVDGAMLSVDDKGLLRNYLNDTTWFGEISGSSLLAAVVYRMAVIRPLIFGLSPYVEWADSIRETLGEGHITKEGITQPAVNPLDWEDREPFLTGSPEGQSFVVLMYAAWRDCILENVCDCDWNSVGKDADEIKSWTKQCS